MKIKLVTAAKELVAVHTIPPFNAPPDIIMWGVRVFSKTDASEGQSDGTFMYVYVEGFAYAIP